MKALQRVVADIFESRAVTWCWKQMTMKTGHYKVSNWKVFNWKLFYIKYELRSIHWTERWRREFTHRLAVVGNKERWRRSQKDWEGKRSCLTSGRFVQDQRFPLCERIKNILCAHSKLFLKRTCLGQTSSSRHQLLWSVVNFKIRV